MKTKFKSTNQSKVRGSVKDPACNYISFPFRAAKRKQRNKETKRLGRKKKKGKKKQNRTKQKTKTGPKFHIENQMHLTEDRSICPNTISFVNCEMLFVLIIRSANSKAVKW